MFSWKLINSWEVAWHTKFQSLKMFVAKLNNFWNLSLPSYQLLQKENDLKLLQQEPAHKLPGCVGNI